MSSDKMSNTFLSKPAGKVLRKLKHWFQVQVTAGTLQVSLSPFRGLYWKRQNRSSTCPIVLRGYSALNPDCTISNPQHQCRVHAQDVVAIWWTESNGRAVAFIGKLKFIFHLSNIDATRKMHCSALLQSFHRKSTFPRVCTEYRSSRFIQDTTCWYSRIR